jgi:type VI secretion system protein ImpK
MSGTGLEMQRIFLIDQLQEYYREVLRLRERVAKGTWVFEDGERAADPEAGASPSAVWRSLVALLDRQALDAGRSGGDFAVEIYRRAQYAMAALGDEVFLHLDWLGREAWREHLIETRLFGSHRAGEELFERIEDLLRNSEVVYADLGRVYLMVLGLGFQGKFRGREDADRELAGYRRRLFRFVFGRDPEAVRGQERLIPQAYSVTLSEGAGGRLPHLKPWLWAIAVLLALWLAGSQLLWRRATRDLRPIVDEILDAGAPPARGSAP